MGFFGLFGKKKKKEKYQAVTATPIDRDIQESHFKEEKKPAPIEKKTEPAAVTKPVENKPAEKKPAPKADAKPAEKKPTPKATAKSAKPKTEPTSEPSEESESESIKLDTTEAVTESRATRNGKFDIRRAKDGRFFFNLYASNQVVIASSQMYSSSTSAINGIKSVMTNAAKAAIEDTSLQKKPESKPFPKWEIYLDRAGQYRFRLYAPNGNCVCHSHGYATKSGCKGGIDSIIRFASEDADINKTYLK